MSNKLFVGNLSFDAVEDDLREAFAECGDVLSVKMPLDRETNRPRGFAFVEMADGEAAQTAMDSLNGRELLGRPLRISEAREQRGGGGGGGGRGGFGGGGRGGRGGGGGGGYRGGGGGGGRW